MNHFDNNGSAIMVDVGEKAQTDREAIAQGCIRMNEDAFSAIQAGTAKKGDVLGVARIAGIMAAKRTSDIIPLCHPIAMTHCSVDFSVNAETKSVHVTCITRCKGQTGVEMEALHGATAALLTIYDMCKALDRGMQLENVHLVQKSGGKSGLYRFGERL